MALICDFAETYHVLNFPALPARYAATLAAGLRPDARIMQKITGAPATAETLLLATIADATRLLVWQNTKDGRKGRNAPASIFGAIFGREKKSVEMGPGFESPEDFRAWHDKMTGGGANG